MKSLYKAFAGVMLAVGFLVAFQSCKPSIPSQYLSRDEMEDILYDIHLAEAMANMDVADRDTTLLLTYRAAVLKKHGVTSAEFDSSMVYYMRHTKLLHDVYTNLAERLTDEAQSLGADVNELNRFGTVEMGDTANVWNGAESMVFSADAPFNYSSFEIPVDTAFHNGDKLMLEFNSQFLLQDGMRDGIAVLAVTFKNDSVYSNNVHISSSQHYSLQVEDRDSLGVKSVKGYFILNRGDFNSDNSSLTTLRMMFLQNIKLIRLHPQKKEIKSLDKEGNGNKPLPKDSALNQEASGDANSSGPRPELSAPRPQMDPDKMPKLEMR